MLGEVETAGKGDSGGNEGGQVVAGGEGGQRHASAPDR